MFLGVKRLVKSAGPAANAGEFTRTSQIELSDLLDADYSHGEFPTGLKMLYARRSSAEHACTSTLGHIEGL